MTGRITFHIGDKQIVKYYSGKFQRTNIINSGKSMRLEGVECYYTIAPDTDLQLRNAEIVSKFLNDNVSLKDLSEQYHLSFNHIKEMVMEALKKKDKHLTPKKRHVWKQPQ